MGPITTMRVKCKRVRLDSSASNGSGSKHTVVSDKSNKNYVEKAEQKLGKVMALKDNNLRRYSKISL